MYNIIYIHIMYIMYTHNIYYVYTILYIYIMVITIIFFLSSILVLSQPTSSMFFPQFSPPSHWEGEG